MKDWIDIKTEVNACVLEKVEVDVHVVDVYISSILHESCNIESDDGPFLYIGNTPTVLPEYL